LKGNIRVFCRVRPKMNGEEGELLKLSMRDDGGITVHSGPLKTVTGADHSTSWDFSFDRVFGPEVVQTEIFEEISLLVQSALDGYRVAIFAYGQTGSGKTYTMEGPVTEKYESEGMGVIPRAVDLIFQEARSLQDRGWVFEVHMTLIEVYNEAVYDLLAQQHNEVKEAISSRGGTDQLNLRRVRAHDAAGVHAMLRSATRERHVAATGCNDHSSRSHQVFQLSLSGSCMIGNRRCEGLLSLVDLAGSERVERSGATGERLREAQYINRSLSALCDVVEAINRRGQEISKGAVVSHVPYRNSRLTMLLKDSLGGESKTLMFVNISPLIQNLGETLSSLRFASKVHVCKVGTAKRIAMDPGTKEAMDEAISSVGEANS